ncbi:hypothetical protein K402DRAFT_412650 [Aulographum hederae CBS 113979]|uniref:Alpha/beta-hydrolase n=1 Tax=Aulographum hederae CBS 113979 TaxID=1176131 RepID=A0A6G1H0Q5_9PEZI|nr:hypothetical protein K402DRAFT_412650 [Aulographum hederae CBS 113979]
MTGNASTALVFGGSDGGGLGKRVEDWSGGSGPYKARYQADETLPEHTIYAPVEVRKGVKLPLIVWANGACASDGSASSNFLAEIASHGFMVIANGNAGKVWGGGVRNGPAPREGKTNAGMLTEAIDWVEKGANGGKFGEVDMEKVATGGISCGGVEAYSGGVRDERVKVLGIHNTGAEQDFRDISPNASIIKAFANVGHGGTYGEKYGGKSGQLSTAFYKWTLNGDEDAKKLLFGQGGPLKEAGWNIDVSKWKQ